MGEEWGATTPFLFFTDFHDQLADAVREGRRREFERFPAFAEPEARARIPDPNAAETFARSRLDWEEATSPAGRTVLARTRKLLDLRRREIVPLMPALGGTELDRAGARAFTVRWHDAAAPRLQLAVNLDDAPVSFPVGGARLHVTGEVAESDGAARLGAWSVGWWRLETGS
jgi:maltooligosyltrehalose trehalohydrolase